MMLNLIRHFRQRQFNTTVIMAYVLFFLSGTIIALSVVFLFTRNLDVLKDWTLIVPSEQIHVGDVVTIASKYTKVRSVTGAATRYLECKDNHGLIIRYQLNTAVADNAPGKRGTGMIVKIPDSIPNPPRECRFAVNVLYHIYPGRNVTEFAASNWFQLLPEVVTPDATQTNSDQSVILYPAQPVGSASSSNDTPATNQVQSNTVQAKPSLLHRVLSPITSILGGF